MRKLKINHTPGKDELIKVKKTWMDNIEKGAKYKFNVYDIVVIIVGTIVACVIVGIR